MANPANFYIMDAKDLWTEYGVFIEKGTDDFLQIPERKESISHEWMDEHGIEVDSTTPFFKDREITLQCAIVAASENDFWTKYDAFVAALMAPGARLLNVVELSRSFNVLYKKCSSFTWFTRLKTVSRIAAKFTLVLWEPNPGLIPADLTYALTDENGNVLTDENGITLTSQ